MAISIHPQKKLSEIQQEFQHLFPYLKLMFFHHTHGKGEASAKSDLITADHTLQEVGKFDGHKELSIKPEMTVNALEKEFQSHYGIGVQVFRRAGAIWIQSSVTDNWSLADQNATAKEETLEKLDAEVPLDSFREQD